MFASFVASHVSLRDSSKVGDGTRTDVDNGRVDKHYITGEKTPLVVGGTRTRELADDMAIAASALNHCTTNTNFQISKTKSFFSNTFAMKQLKINGKLIQTCGHFKRFQRPAASFE